VAAARHDLEGLLHPVHMLHARFDERLSMPVVGLTLDLQRASEHPPVSKPYVGSPLKPLGNPARPSTSGPAAHVARSTNTTGIPEVVFQDPRDGHPVDARRLHSHRRHAAAFRPTAQLEQVGRRAPDTSSQTWVGGGRPTRRSARGFQSSIPAACA